MKKTRLFLFLSILSPNLAVWLTYNHGSRFAFAVFWSLVLTLAACAMPRRLFWLVLGAALVLLPVTIYWIGYAAINGYAPNFQAVATMFHTDLSEAAEALSMALRYPMGPILVLSHVVFLGLAITHYLRNQGSDLSSNLRSVAILVCMVSLLSAFSIQNAGLRQFSLITEADALDSYPLSLPVIMDELVEVNFQDTGTSGPHTRLPPAHDIAAITSPLLSGMVVGESTRADYFGPNVGNPGPNALRLLHRVQSGLGIWLPPVCASSNGTHMSVPMLLTGTSPQNFASASRAPSGLAYLKAGGYTTAWISNQTRDVFVENGWDFSSWNQMKSRRAPDGELLPIVEHFVADYALDTPPGKPKSFVLHLMGTHFNFEERYPHDMFTPEPSGLPEEQLESLRYGRAVEYQAKVLLDLAAILDRSPWPAFFVYTSDHGENLLSDHNGLHYHLAKRTSQKDAWVPALVIYNKKFLDSGRLNGVFPKLSSARFIAHKDIFNAWMALSGIPTPLPLTPDSKPMIFANGTKSAGYQAVSCSDLSP